MKFLHVGTKTKYYPAAWVLRILKIHLITTLAFIPILTAQAQIAIPDATRPGAVRPEQTGRSLLPPAAPAPEEMFEQPDAVLEVGPVIDRPFEIDDGPKVAVREFRLPDAVDLPDFDITMAELAVLLQDEIDAKPEGFTVGQLQEAADVVTLYYREKGLILAQAVVPIQTVDAGIVIIQVFEGKLGRVVVEGNDRYKESLLTSPFKKLIGQPVTQAAIESAILEITAFPGLSVFGVFQPGQQVGTADIILRVQGEKTFDLAYRVDNNGLLETGKYRFRPSFEWNNPTGGADRLSLSVQQTYVPKNNTFTSADYDRYLYWGIRAGIGWNRNVFDVGGELAAQEIKGETRNHTIFFEKYWLRSRQMNFSARVGFAHKDSTTKTRGRQTNNDKLSVFSYSTSFDNVDTRFLGINFVTLEFSHGAANLFGAMGNEFETLELDIADRSSRTGDVAGTRTFASGNFSKLFTTASRLQTIKSDYGLSLLLRGENQWSTDILVPMEQYSIGGPDNVRAYPPAQQLVDRGTFLSIELIKNMPFIGDKAAIGNRTWGELIQLSAFFDAAWGRLNNPLSSNIQEGLADYVNFRGAGVQMRLTLPGLLESRVMVAKDVTHWVPDNNRPYQLWADLTYRF
ncbi:MAG: hemolysin activation/secretion protein [Gammaproteobacteria bacterium]|jgi:hemolysin activation/secretion protein